MTPLQFQIIGALLTRHFDEFKLKKSRNKLEIRLFEIGRFLSIQQGNCTLVERRGFNNNRTAALYSRRGQSTSLSADRED